MGYALTIEYLEKPTYSTWNKSFIVVLWKAWIESWKPKTFSIKMDLISQTDYVFGKD